MRKFARAALCVLLGTTALAGVTGAFAQEPTDEIVVRGARIPDEKRATSEISAVLDEEAFARTGDSDIGEALARVTGLSLAQGKYIIVRGLNQRYSNVTLNGSPLPSPEPLQRVAPLDIVPTAILSGTLVQKTYSPEFSAEFGGGLIELRAKGVPDEAFLTLGGSIGLDSEATFKDGLTYDGGGRDWLGFDDGTRSYPAPLAGVLATGDINGTNQDAIDTSLEHSKTLLILENETPPNWDVGASGGERFDLSDSVSLGAVFSLGLSNEWKTRVGRREQGLLSSGNFGNEGQVYDFDSTSLVAETHGILTVGAEIGDNHEITLTNFILRSTAKEARISEGTNGDCACDFLRTNSQFIERQVWQTQARGDHLFPFLGDLEAAWRFAYGEAFRDSPYERVNSYVGSSATGVFGYDFGRVSDTLANTVSFSSIEDENIDAGIDFKLPFELFNGESVFKFGYAYTEKDRTTLNRLFQYRGSAIPELAFSRIDLIYSDEVLGTSLIDIGLVNGTFFHDNTDSQLQVSAGYGGFDLELGSYLRLAAGVRYESGSQSTSSFATLFPSSFTQTRIDEDYFLPAATLTWNPAGDLQVRFGYSQTITRPQFRELAPAFFVDEDTDLLLLGNPFLVNSEIDNFDARLEYYFGRGQFLTFGGFYKDITKPIEDAFRLEAGGLIIASYINAPAATLWGFEMEFEKNFILSNIVDWGFVATKDLVFKTNYTFSQSDVSDEGTVITGGLNGVTQRFVPNEVPATNFVTPGGRSLQGQSDHLFNLQIGVQDEEQRSRATFLVNWSSRRIRNVDAFLSGVTAPPVIETPPILVDFVYSKGFGPWEVGLKIENILGDDYEAHQFFADGTEAKFDTYSLGREFSLSLKRDF